jgi:2-methylcitrate dehydratase PrpD
MSASRVAMGIDTLAEFAVSASAGPSSERLAIHIADGVIALLAGKCSPEGKRLDAFFRRSESLPLATLSANAAAMRLSEIDDIHRSSGVTASAIALPSALAMAACGPADPRRFADAVIVGQSVAIELALAMGGAGLMAQGLWPSYLVAPVGAAAAAGRMLGLSATHMRHALAIALAQTPRSVGRSAGQKPARWLVFANAVRSGYLAALAAADGFEGDAGLLDEAWLKSVGRVAAQASVATPVIRVGELSIKPHCAAKQTLAAIHGLQLLMADGLAPSSIDSIEVRVPPAYATMIDREPASASRLASMVSVRWQLALTALRPCLLDDVSRDAFPCDPPLNAFAAKVKVIADSSLDSYYPAAWPAHLTVRTGGAVLESFVSDSRGDPALPFGATDIQSKATRVLGDHPHGELVQQLLCPSVDTDVLVRLTRHFS